MYIMKQTDRYPDKSNKAGLHGYLSKFVDGEARFKSPKYYLEAV